MHTPFALTLELTRDGEGWEPRAMPQLAQRYLLRVDGGGPKPTAPFPWDRERQQDLATLARADAEQRARLGTHLARTLAPAGWEALGQRILDSLRVDRVVVMTLALRAAELFLLPWELLELPDGTPLGEHPKLLLRFAWPDTDTRAPRTHNKGHLDPRLAEGRVLFAWAGAVPHAAHQEALEGACAEGFRTLSTLPDVRLSALEAALAEEPPVSVLHLLVHGSAKGLHFDEGIVPPKRLAARLSPFADRVRLVVLCACESAKVGGLGSALGSVAEALHRAGFEAVSASRDPLSKLGSIALTQALYPALLRDLASLEAATLLARAAVSAADRDTLQLWTRGDADTRPLTHRPYRGLEVFDRAHRRFFLGREAEAQEALDDLDGLYTSANPRLLFVSGASGSGKSSLVRAAVAPRLTEHFAAIHVTRPGSGLVDLPPERPLLLVLDQAEELFTALHAEARQALVTRLHALATDAAGSAVILTMRVDFLGRTGELLLPDGRRLDQLAYDEAHRVFVPMMSRDQMLEVIEGPARLVGLPIQEGLAEQLVDEVAGEPGALPLLEFALDRLWLERAPGEGLTLGHYKALGGAVGALLEREADALLKGFTEEERTEARRLLVQLVSTGEGQRSDTRRVRQRAELGGGEAFESVLNRLADARLVVTGEAGRVEIAHEELIRRWGTLRAWVDADRQKWIEVERVRSWTHLLRGGQLDRAKEARERYGAELGEATLAHIAASEEAVAEEAAREARRQAELKAAKEAAEVEAQRARRRARVAAGLGVVAVMVALVAGWFYQASEANFEEAKAQEQEAKRLGEESRLEAVRAKNILRLSAASSVKEDVPNIAMALLADLDVDNLRRLPWTWSDYADVLDRQGRRPLAELWHSGEVEVVAFSPDGQTILTGSDDNTARLWRALDGAPIGEPMEHKDSVQAVAFSPDGQTILTGSRDNTARLWRAQDGAPIGQPMKHEDPVVAVAFSPDGQTILTGSRDNTARLWRAQDGAPIGEPMEHEDSVVAVAFSPDGQTLLTGSGDNTAKLWRAHDGAPIGKPMEHEGHVRAVAFAPDGQTLLTGSEDHTARLWRAQDGAPIGEPMEHENDVRAVAFSPDGQTLLTGSDDNTARIWRAHADAPIGEPMKQEGIVWAVAFSPDGQTLLTGSWNYTARLWRAHDGAPIGEPMEHEGHVRAVAFSPDGQTLLTGSDDHTARLWSALDGAPIGEPMRHEGYVTAVAFSPDGRTLLTGSGDNTARLWRAHDGEPIGEPMEHKNDVQAVAFSPDGRTILTGSDDHTARLWRAQDGEPIGKPMEHEDVVFAVAFSPDGETLLTGSRDGTAKLWRTLDGAPIGKPMEHEGPVSAAAFSPEGETLLTGSWDGTARLWRALDGAPIGKPMKHEYNVWAVTFSPDGQTLLTGSYDRTARLWRALDGAPIGQPMRHEGAVYAVAFSPDGKTLLTSSNDVALLWDATDGHPLYADLLVPSLRNAGVPCLTPPRRAELLLETEEEALSNYEACLADRQARAAP
ncbi:MAG: CHAT domain-containing protein [Alphaproteobacteria bacterium]|nr:CHAT domain-containing protein [Alphaproteobacteria bacterium]MCB9794552.1 CHAT domain-containing protein [Alphaproteobacteria bacterium]